MEQLESRVLFSGGVDTSSVVFFNAWGSPSAIDPTKQIWILFHGLNMSKDQMTSMAQPLQAARPNDQVLVVDWSVLANSGNAYVEGRGWWKTNSQAVADWTARQVVAAGVRASHVNLIGFSMGGEVMGDVAHALHGKRAMVNRIIGVDPAGDGGHPFALDSSYAIAFTANDKYSSWSASAGADDTVLVADLPSDDMARHEGMFGFYTTILMREAGMEYDPSDHVSSIFSTTNIMSGNVPRWQKNAFNGVFEAEVTAQPVGGWRYAPTAITYVAAASSRRRGL